MKASYFYRHEPNFTYVLIYLVFNICLCNAYVLSIDLYTRVLHILRVFNFDIINELILILYLQMVKSHLILKFGNFWYTNNLYYVLFKA